MPHILVKTPATISHVWEVDGTPTDPDGDTTTIGITRADGSELVPAGTATTHGVPDSGEFTFPITSTHTAELDILTAIWKATLGGSVVEIGKVYEIVGAHLFTETQMRGHKVEGGTPFADTVKYPDAKIVQTREQVTDDFAGILNFQPIPRYTRETHDGTGTDELALDELYPVRPIAVTVDGTVWDAGALADIDLASSGVAILPAGVWPAGRRNITIAYVHGGDAAILRRAGIALDEIASAALRRAAMKLAPGLSSTASSAVTPEGTAYTFEAAGRRVGDGDIQHFGVPSIDSVLNRYRKSLAKVGF